MMKYPKPWGKKRRHPRDFWLQYHDRSDEIINVRINCSYHMAAATIEITLAEDKNLQAAYLISGAVPENELMAPPKSAVWERWESAEGANPEDLERRGLSAAYDPMDTVRTLAHITARSI